MEVSYGVWDEDGKYRDKTTAGKILDGSYDLANIPARTWDVEGLDVTTLRPVSAPFLVDTNSLAASIASGDLANELMSGLSKLGLTGLVLLPDRMRHPVGFSEPLVRAADYEGKGIRAAYTPTIHSLFRELGAEPMDVIDWQARVAAGEIVGAETSFSFLYNFPSTSIVTGNVTLYTKMNTIVMNAASLDRLTPDQQEILRQAAAATLTEAIASIPDESAAAAAACEDGATVVTAGEEDLAALIQAAGPVFTELEQDPQTKASIAAIRDLKSETASADTVRACGPGSAVASSDPSLAPSDPSVLNGTYRREVDAADLRVVGMEESAIPDFVGTYEMTLTDGTYEWRIRQEQPAHEPWIVHGTYVLNGDQLASDITDPPNGPRGQNLLIIDDSYRWTVAGATLTVTLVATSGDPDWGGILSGVWTQLP